MAFDIKKILGNIAQSLTDSEKLQARQNIDACKAYVTNSFPENEAEWNRWKDALLAGVPILMPRTGGFDFQLNPVGVYFNTPNDILIENIYNGPSGWECDQDTYTLNGHTVTHTNNTFVIASGQSAIVSTTPIDWWSSEITFNSSMFDQQTTGYQDIGKTYTVQPGQILQFFINTNFKVNSLSYANNGSFSDHTWGIILHTTGNYSDIKSRSSFCSVYLQAGQSTSDSEMKPVSATLMYKNTTSSPVTLDVALMTTWGNQYLTGSIQLKNVCIGDVTFN